MDTKNTQALRIRNFIIEHYDPGTPADPAYVSAEEVIEKAVACAGDQILSDDELKRICKQVIEDAEKWNAYDECDRWLRMGGDRFDVIHDCDGHEDLLASIQALRKKGIALPAILVKEERYIHDIYVKFRIYIWKHIDLPPGLTADALFEKAVDSLSSQRVHEYDIPQIMDEILSHWIKGDKNYPYEVSPYELALENLRDLRDLYERITQGLQHDIHEICERLQIIQRRLQAHLEQRSEPIFPRES